MENSTVASGAQVIALPTAAAEPVVNPKRKGSYPRGANVFPAWRVRLRREKRKQSVGDIDQIHCMIDVYERTLTSPTAILTQMERDELNGRIYRLTCELGRLGRREAH